MSCPFPLAAKETNPAPDLTNLQQQQYVHNLFTFIAQYLQQVSDAGPVLSEKPTHPFQPGGLVLLVTRTAVKVKGTPSWVHASRVKATTSAQPKPSTVGRRRRDLSHIPVNHLDFQCLYYPF
uniref:Uncharacterized protein n=1 Tax=Periophthalmus magnuspinnatus TaxID=409849 RepID=A0A3B3Z9R2_9GOBI